MFVGELTDAYVTAAPQFRVTARNVTLESKCADSGVKHYFTVSLNISAFTFDDSNRAFSNVRLNINNVKPLPMVDEEGNILPIKVKEMKISDFSDKPTKLTYAVYRYVWENTNDPTIVVGKSDKTAERNVEAFAVSFHDMHEHLVERGTIPQNCNPVSINGAISRLRTNATARPIPRTMSTVYSYSTNVRKTIWDAPCFSLENLMNEKLPFSPNILTKTSTAAMET
ncbi:uncharacterized protein EV154DRAFT_531327 [Mucor mucedo]|uniref:uncharacterized protein n=1 Tax=Mucor mucedo TaxID=29922 RepID=UPI0022200500|nr:uncharacterized protein EV154DRAFT_531327 [Mucor mucedo]KAI7868390.1 hypothetical protein EV154DRAFT_531327 [Mucor mucedo]